MNPRWASMSFLLKILSILAFNEFNSLIVYPELNYLRLSFLKSGLRFSRSFVLRPSPQRQDLMFRLRVLNRLNKAGLH
jgi:hypothetical protein